jgi:hypothetical protein
VPVAFEHAHHAPANVQFTQHGQQPGAPTRAVPNEPDLQRTVGAIAQVVPSMMQGAIKVN